MSSAPSETSSLSALSQLEDPLSVTERKIARLQLDGQSAIQAILQERNSTCRIHTLPDEILLSIFYLLVEDYEERQTEALRYPWITAAVCDRWRMICLDNPRLWRHFHLSHTVHYDHKYDAPDVFRTSLQLKRSADAPLVIDAKLCRCDGQVTQYRAVAAQCHRWEVAILGDDRNHRMNFIVEIVPPGSRFPALRRLEWNVRVMGPLPTDEAIIPFMDYTSLVKLESASIDGIGWTFASGADLPWKQLTRLNLKGCSGSDHRLLTVLSYCQALAFLGLDIYELAEGEYATSVPFILPRVECFKYRPHDYFPTYPKISTLVLPYITMPCLSYASLSSLNSDEDIQTVADLIERSSCSTSLTFLHITYTDPHYHGVIALDPLLKLCTSLQTLRIDNAFYCPTVITADTGNHLMQSLAMNGPDSLCPALEVLNFFDISIDLAVVMRTLDSRMLADGTAGVSKLRILRWRVREQPYDPGRRERFEPYQALLRQKYSTAGLHVEVGMVR